MLEHPNIVRILGYCTSPQLKVAMELIDGGDLYNVLHEKVWFEAQELLQYAYDIAMGMEYLHSFTPPVLHRDLKSPNILVSKKKVNGIDQNILKISDFGLARVAATNMDSEKMTQAGTPYWSAPELLRNEVYNEKVDVYSCAIVFYEIYGQRSPYEHKNSMEVSVQVTTPDKITGKYLRPDMSFKEFSEMPEDVETLIIKMWDNDPTKRPTFTEVCNELERIAKTLNFTLRTSSRPAQAAQVQVQASVQDNV
jgi:serine/threonine-protein kinase CTR1